MATLGLVSTAPGARLGFERVLPLRGRRLILVGTPRFDRSAADTLKTDDNLVVGTRRSWRHRYCCHHSSGTSQSRTIDNGQSGAPVVVDGSGTLNYLSKWSPDGDSLGIQVIYDNATNVGIGTTAPPNS